MILPITVYGHSTLKKVAKDIDKDYPDLQELIADMYETMYRANGVGLAAPQVNKSIRLFVVDARIYKDEFPETAELKQVFINAQIIERTGEEWATKEGCLSVPKINEEVFRQEKIRIQYYDENFDFHDEYYEGWAARVIQHEYDHLDGILFVDRLSNMKKMMLRRKLQDISKGKTEVDYKVILPGKK
jgi:peptide deformylase